MKNLKNIELVSGILVLLFAVGFYVFGWQEPTQPPPGGNVAAPLNTSATPQTKAGDLTIGTATVKGDGSVSPGLNADKLDSYNAADLIVAVPSGPWIYLGKTPGKQGGAIGILPKKGLEVLIAFDFGSYNNYPYSYDIICSVAWSIPTAAPKVTCSNDFTPLYYRSLDWTASSDKSIRLWGGTEQYYGWKYEYGIYLRGDGWLYMETSNSFGSSYQYGIAWAWYREKSI